MAYDLADIVPLAVQVKDATGALADATSVTLTVTHTGTSTVYTPSVTHPSTGNYQASFAPALPGRHTVRWVATGLNASGFSDSFEVYDALPPSILSLADARELLRLSGTTQDELLRTKLAATTYVIERHLDEIVVQRSFTEDYPNVVPGRFLALRNTPVVSLTSIAATNGFYTWDVAAMHFVPSTGLITALPSAWGLWGDISVTYVAGRSVIPENYLEAAKIILQHNWMNRRGTAGTAAPLGMADTMHLAGKLGWGFAIPNAALEWLGAPVTGFA